MRGEECIGLLVLAGKRTNIFGHREVALAESFRDQAVIAIQNTRLFEEVQAKTRDLVESLEHQTATSEVLQVIGSSMADSQPVFERILDSMHRLFDWKDSAIFLAPDDGLLHLAARRGDGNEALDQVYPRPIGETSAPVVIGQREQIYYPDVMNGANVPESLRRAGRATENFSVVLTPMLWDGQGVGLIGVSREPNAAFHEKELSMLRTFADQAVIAIQNARLFNEVQTKSRDLEEALRYQTGSANILNVIASSPTDVEPVLKAIVESACELCEAHDAVVLLKDGDELCFSAHHGPIPIKTDRWPIGRGWASGRAVVDRATVHVHDIYAEDDFTDGRELSRRAGSTAVRSILAAPLLREGESIGAILLRRQEVRPFNDKQISMLQTFADQAVIAIENARLFDEVQQRTRDLSRSLDELRTAQDRLVQTEKLASLGQLTAGIAHEIKNPLNFVNNFSALSIELLDELDETLSPAPLDQTMRGNVGELTAILKSNLERVVQHGKRADSIVKNMLQHSREGSGERRLADINVLVGESLHLAYHGARAEKPDFAITLRHDLDPDAGALELYPQEITRALLNLISNGFYAATRRKAENDDGAFEPVLSAATRNRGDTVEIRIHDNGAGIPPDVKEKMFNPFFTTKPTGEGTGLGLSMTHDIIVKQHGGRIDVETEPGAFTEFIITLPRG